ncbi:MAG: glycerol-3-phosphate 1-O-acyltransferase PlsY [Sumerlaeia bacterium]
MSLFLVVQLLLAYAIGAIPTGLMIGKVFAGVDLREEGSKNIGFTNALRVLGPKLGIPVLLIDVVKAILPILLLPPLQGVDLNPELHGVLLGVALLVGNLFNVFLGFKGGKGVATSLGVFLALAPYSILLAFGVFLVTFAISRYVSLGSILAAVTTPLFVFFLNDSGPVLIMATAASFFVLFKHRSNFQRLIAGKEHKWHSKKAGAEKAKA